MYASNDKKNFLIKSHNCFQINVNFAFLQTIVLMYTYLKILQNIKRLYKIINMQI